MIIGLPTETAADWRKSFDVVAGAIINATKYNNLILYPGTPIYEELKNTGRIVKTKHWGNFNSTLAMTHNIFSKTPIPYVPETCSEWQLKKKMFCLVRREKNSKKMENLI